VRFGITTHDTGHRAPGTGHRLTAADFDLARRIDAVAAAHDATALAD
jgi:4a-hydroxytetrahydrobiopterin dehydratase